VCSSTPAKLTKERRTSEQNLKLCLVFINAESGTSKRKS